MFLVAVVFTSSADAQITFERWYGGTNLDEGHSVAKSSDSNGYVIAGMTSSFGAGSWDVYLIRTDSIGDTLWTKTYGGTSVDVGHSIAQTNDAGYIIVGFTRSFGAGENDVYLIKTDSIGDTTWTKTYGGSNYDVGNSVAQTTDEGYIIAGATSSFGTSMVDVYLIKTDSVGDTIWTRTYGGDIEDGARSVTETSDGGYIVAGYSCSFGTDMANVYLIKTDSLGNTLWTKIYGGVMDDEATSVIQTSDGGYLITGYTRSFGAGKHDVYLIKTDSIGDTIWTKTYGGPETEWGGSIIQTLDGNYLIVGSTNSFGAIGSDVYIIKVDSVGDTTWTKTYGGTINDGSRSVVQTNDAGYIIAGTSKSPILDTADVYLIKTDYLGNVAGINEEEKNVRHKVTGTKLSAYPNPFTTSTTISFAHKEQNVKSIGLEIYNASGRMIKNFLISQSPIFKVIWDGKNMKGEEIRRGVYFLKVDGYKPVKIIKLK